MAIVCLAGGPEYPCAEDDTLLRAGLRAGLGLPYECNAGSCGSCKVELIEGSVTSLRPDAPGLLESERARNRVLACQARPDGDCTIKVRLRPENVPPHRPARFSATLVATREVTHDIREFRFRAEHGPRFSPGQYALLYLPGLAAPRTYSMSNVDMGDGTWEFMVRRLPGGTGTATLFDAVAPGARLAFDGPYGLAYLRADRPRDLMCLAGGSGLAPVLSIVRAAVREPRLAGRRIHVLYGGRTERDLCAEPEMQGLPGFGERLFVQSVVSEPDAAREWTGPTGLVHERLPSLVDGRWAEFEYYFAGPPAMAQAVQRMLIDQRVPYPQVHFDSFY